MKFFYLILITACTALISCAKKDNNSNPTPVSASVANSKIIGNWAAHGKINDTDVVFNTAETLLIYQIKKDLSFVVIKKFGSDKLKQETVGSAQATSETEGQITIDKEGIQKLKDMGMNFGSDSQEVISFSANISLIEENTLKMDPSIFTRVSDEELQKLIQR